MVLGDLGRPEAILEIAWVNDDIGTWFLDSEVRRHLHYSFFRVRDRMFLRQVTLWDLPPGAILKSEARTIEVVLYQPDGIVSQTVRSKAAGKTELVEKHGVDVSPHWEQIPVFGEWASMARYDRTSDSNAEQPFGKGT